ncbi:MAG: deoxyribodipyrimidine photo-lyase [Acuticoccus sp.]
MSIDQSRVIVVNDCSVEPSGRYVLYWMQHGQRADDNPALERAVDHANAAKLPLFVLFVIDPDYPEANARHYTFMLEGLAETMAAVRRRGAHMALRLGSPPEVASRIAQEAAAVVLDRGYLRHLVTWRKDVAAAAPCVVEMVEGETIVPVEAASGRRETAARTIRRKLMERARALAPDDAPPAPLDTAPHRLASDADVEIGDVARFVEALGCDDSVPPVEGFAGGAHAARTRLGLFLSQDLPHYGDGRANMVQRRVSRLSPYLHFGQISPLTVYRAALAADAPAAAKDSFIDELLVRRELAINFIHHTADYDAFTSLPAWARQTLAAHADDPRDTVFTRRELEEGKTGDRYWNAAMREMRVTGYLHNHMRMYWGKRLIAYTNTPQTAFRTALDLNNKYLLDGRDANSYANIGWLFGLHDRGWPERPVFGKVRSMTPGGLKRKFDIDAYVRWAEAL